MRPASIVFIAALSGCTWISKDDVAAREPQLDNDGDGVIASKDCDDTTDKRSPNNEEVWYDGIDGDCGNDDDYDADKDGRVPSAYLGIKTQEVKGTGILLGGDCDDTDGSINPLATDTWYDGIDTNCDGNDDFDKDSDGFASKDHEYGPTMYADGTGSLEATDCDDNAEDVNPDIVDAWYDGVDSDCMGEDDYDQDGDTYYDENLVPAYGETLYAENTGVASAGDCDDTDPNVYLNAEDPWYDGVDSNCLDNDDFDQDGDGFVKNEHVGQPTEYRPAAELLPGGDCDDSLATGATANPNETEVMHDSIDHDCDSLSAEVGATTFHLHPLDDSVYNGVHTLIWGENYTGIYFAVGAEERAVPENLMGVVDIFGFDPTDPIGSIPTQDVLNDGNTSYSLNPNAAAFWVGDDVRLSATGSLWSSLTERHLFIRGFDDSPGLPVTSETGASQGLSSTDIGVSDLSPLHDIDMLRMSDGSFHVIGCENTNDVLQYNRATNDSLHIGEVSGSSVYTEVLYSDDYSASRCALIELDDELVLLGNQDGGLTAHVLDREASTVTLTDVEVALGASLDPRLNSDVDVEEIVVPARATDGWFIIADDFNNDVLVVSPDFDIIQEIDTGTSPTSINASFDAAGETLYIMFINDEGDGWITWGDPYDAVWEDLYKLGTDDLTEGAMWIDGTTNNIISVVASVSSSTSLLHGTAYIDPMPE